MHTSTIDDSYFPSKPGSALGEYTLNASKPHVDPPLLKGLHVVGRLLRLLRTRQVSSQSLFVFRPTPNPRRFLPSAQVHCAAFSDSSLLSSARNDVIRVLRMKNTRKSSKITRSTATATEGRSRGDFPLLPLLPLLRFPLPRILPSLRSHRSPRMDLTSTGPHSPTYSRSNFSMPCLPERRGSLDMQ